MRTIRWWRLTGLSVLVLASGLAGMPALAAMDCDDAFTRAAMTIHSRDVEPRVKVEAYRLAVAAYDKCRQSQILQSQPLEDEARSFFDQVFETTDRM